MKAAIAALLGAALAAPAFSEPPMLDLPIDCRIGESCYIEDYVDHDPGAGQQDFACGLKSRDGHSGTDIVLLSFEAMASGVAVLAAAPGRVEAVRDGVPDQPFEGEMPEGFRGKECGNGVRIGHGDGWQTLYCHMRRGSVAVTEGQLVNAGDQLGFVGLSGQTNVPHVHLTVLKDGEPVDPFLPDADRTCGVFEGAGLWRDPPGYDRAGLFTAGFATGVPHLKAVQTGAARVRKTGPGTPLVLYGHVFLADPGDRLTLSASGPGGEIFRKTVILEEPQRQLFRAYGRQSPEGGWPAGEYRGYVRLERGNRVIAVRHADITVRR